MKRTRPDIGQYKDLLSSSEMDLFRSQIGLALDVSRKTLRNVDECEKHLDAALYGLFKAVKKYDRSLGSLVGFVSKCVRNEIISQCCSQDWRRLWSEVDPDEICDTDSVEKTEQISEVAITIRQKRVLLWRKSGLTFAEIGRNLGVSRVQAYRVYSSINVTT